MNKATVLSMSIGALLVGSIILFEFTTTGDSADDTVAAARVTRSTGLKPFSTSQSSKVENGAPPARRTSDTDLTLRRSPAAQMLEAADGSRESTAIAAKSVSAFCAPYYEHLTNKEVVVSAKVGAWCSGIEETMSASELSALSESSAELVSPVQQAATFLMSQKPGPDASSKALQLARVANSPGDMASAADILKRLDPSSLFRDTSLNPGDPRVGTITHFAGMASWCGQSRCGPSSEATMLVCTWPGFTCGANDDFNTALSRNFSPTDLEKIVTVGQRLSDIKSGY